MIRFSALQRAENSSKGDPATDRLYANTCFSALQRAENSSKSPASRGGQNARRFQCSSASRKFLKNQPVYPARVDGKRFSALQRAENSSKRTGWAPETRRPRVSVLFSEPKIPQIIRTPALVGDFDVSVLFSEPKIPQNYGRKRAVASFDGFSALQRAENSSKSLIQRGSRSTHMFQCSSASRKFLKRMMSASARYAAHCSFSALQRAENSSNRSPASRNS